MALLFSVALALLHWVVAETILSLSCHYRDHDGGRGRNASMVETILLLLCAQKTDQKRTQICFGASCGEGFRVLCSYSDLLLR